MQKTFVVIPRGGLGNRIRVVGSALNFSKVSGCRIVVVWQLTPELNCRYEELFNVVHGLKIYNANRYASRLQETLCGIASKALHGIVDFYDDKSINELSDKIKNYKNGFSNYAVVRVNESFCGSDWDADWFLPAENLILTIDEVCQSYTSHTIGVHIRRQDNDQAILNSKTYCFIEKMNSMIDEYTDVKFYLATDCIETENMMCDLYGSRIIVRDKLLDRNESKGVKDALIDMYCLSRTDSIIGSYWSSFSVAASQIGKVPLHIVSKLDQV